MAKLLDQLKSINYKRVLEIQFEIRPRLRGFPYWTAAVLVGIVAVLYSNAFSQCISLAHRLWETHPYALFIVSPLCFLLATWIVEKYAPAAGGTGVPQVVRALSFDPVTQSKEIDAYLSLRVALVVTVSSLLCMVGAGALGREGPMVHIGACLFYFVGTHFHKFWPYEEHRSWIVAGGAAGIAAAFNAPLAGVVFVLEELAQQHFHLFKTVVISAAIISGMVSQWLSGRYLYFGYPKLGNIGISSVPWAMLVGILCGLFAFPFNWMITIHWREKLPNYFQTRLGFAVFTGLCVAALAIFVNPGTIGGGVAVIENLLFKDQDATWSLIIGRILATTLSHLSGCAGGFLAPSLALGAAIGSKLAVLVSYTDPKLFVMVGMAAFLSAIIGAPFTAWVIVMEMTDSHPAIFPLMVASLMGYATTQFMSKKAGR